MRTIQSPCGATYPYYYKNGELFGFHLGSFEANEQGAIERMRSESDFLCEPRQSPGHLDRPLRYEINRSGF
jgi:hypothetical protein